LKKLKRLLEQKRFVSLKWQLFFVISLIIISVNSIYFYYQNNKIEMKYEQERMDNRRQDLGMLDAIIRQNSSELQNLGSILPSMYGLKHHFDTNQWDKVGAVIEDIWPNFQVTYEIEGIGLFDREGNMLYSSEPDSLYRMDTSTVKETVSYVVSSLQPKSVVACMDDCAQVSVVPYLSRTSKLGAIAIYAPVTDIVLRFSDLASSEVGILGEAGLSPTRLPRLDEWHMQIAALTNFGNVFKVLETLSLSENFSDLIDRKELVQLEDKIYDIFAVPLDRIAVSSRGFLFFIKDVSEDQAELERIAKDSFLLSLFGLISSEMAILLLLWRPLSRLISTSHTLPMLARGEFARARTFLSRANENAYIVEDEIDMVNASAIALSDQLEKLNREVEESTLSLKRNMEKLRREKDFSSYLLDTAQVIIVATNSRGKIELVNKYGQMLLEMQPQELVNKSFDEVFTNGRERDAVRKNIEEINKEKKRHFSQETSFITSSQKHRSIAWIHSFLGDVGEQNVTTLSVGTDITERKEAERRITWLANHDPLTGLFNRRHFNELFENYLNQATRYGKSGALLFLDLDNFKYINDTKGHQTGDRLIKEVASALRRITRNSDIVSRIGGDEFAIVIPDIDKNGVIEFCNNLNVRINTVIKPIVSVQQKVTTSIGVALFPTHGSNVTQLLANADIAMYQAKERGRSRWHVYSESEQAMEKIQLHVNWKERIENALKYDRFILFFQPIMKIDTGEITHFEVLLRMLGESGAIIAPYPFIKVAENTGLINDIDRMVLLKTLDFMKANHHTTKNTNFSVNLSARTFSDKRSIPMIKELLLKSNIDTRNLIFEITETAALQDITAASALVDELRSMGCRIAIDDFGVGFSSFYYLRELAVDYVKIDGSFIQQLSSNRDDQLIVRAMSEIVRGFGKKTIAEYVEDEKTLELLKGFNVDYAQGYYIGTPEQMKNEEEVA